MTPVEALEVALEKEKTSIALYQDLIVKHPVIKDLLYSLLIEEQKHKKLIEERIIELTR